jgi:hypothetical protein
MGLFPELRGCRRQQQVHKDNEPGWGSMEVQQERVEGQSPLAATWRDAEFGSRPWIFLGGGGIVEE